MATPGGTPGPWGAPKDLASTPEQKRAAARAIEDHIEPDTRTSGAWADEDTAALVKELGARDGNGWLASGALQKAHQVWEAQIKSLMRRLSSEKAALQSTTGLFHRTDVGVRSQIRPSSLDHY